MVPFVTRLSRCALALLALPALAACELSSSAASAEAPAPAASATNKTPAVQAKAPPPAPTDPAPAPAPAADRPPTAVPPAAPQPGAPAHPTTPRFAGTGLTQELILRQLAVGQPLSFKPVGSTSTVFRVRMAGPVDAAFKSVTSDRPLGPLAEVAAYRLARCLQLDNVPPAVSRSVPLAAIRDGLDADERGAWEKIAALLEVGTDGLVHGVAIYWIPDLSNVGLESRGDDRMALGWLHAHGRLPEDRRALAGSVSTMVAFDYLVGNFDRWSGGNVRGDARGQRVYIRDHDLAFPAKMREQLHRRLWQTVVQVERFSRSFYQQLRALDRPCFERELAADLGATEHLSERQILGVLDRRHALLSHIEALISLRGQERVLVFD
ncbi:MAG TPA: hypothetical protein VK509_23545 [Polyangiales bacterium]|nr:hypothetical protein [Polyangiales bacterium]